MSLWHSDSRSVLPLLVHLFFGATALASSASAAEIKVDSTIDAVTIFPIGAEITRTFTVKLEPGEHTLILHLPGDLQQNSIQVEGVTQSDIAISFVNVRRVSAATNAKDPARKEIQRLIEQHKVELSTLERTIEDAVFSRNLMATLAERKLQPKGLDAPPSVPSPEELSSLLDLVDGRLSKISKTVLDARARQREVGQKIEALNRRLKELAPTDKPLTQASIHIISQKAGSATLHLSYRLASASWQPMYEARLTTGEDGKKARLRLIRHAMVAQATTEQWKNVELTLSTARPTGATSAPELKPQNIRSFASEGREERVQRTAPAAVAEKTLGTKATRARPPDGEGAVRRMQASATIAGFQALYAIPGRVTIDNTGTSMNVRIGSDDLDTELSLKAVPKLDLTAYLVARFASKNTLPLLPGPVMLFRDSVFVGEGKLPLLSPGEPVDLGFGADDLVKIERRETSRKTGETGLISSAHIDERSYLTTITSQHATAIPITILDQVPYAADERIRVELLSKTTKPSQKDVDGKRGIYGWSMMLKPRSRNEIRFGFRVTWPKGIRR